jgi:KinB signaling pathway activation protein
VNGVDLKKWFFLFVTTALLGGLSVIPTAMMLGYEGIMGESLSEMLAVGTWLFVVGLLFSVISQMGFFAYLMLHRFGLGLFKSHKLWNRIQLLLIVITFFDLVYFRYKAFSEPGESWMAYIVLPTFLFIVAILAAYWKARETERFTFVPAIFFIYVVTAIEVLPALTQNDVNWVILMLIPILLCNVWQLLILHRLTSGGQEKSA